MKFSRKTQLLQKFELKYKKTLVILYYDNIGTTQVCAQVQAVREKIVDNLKASPVKVYDYYKPGRYLKEITY